MKAQLDPEEIPLCPHCDQPIEFSDCAIMSAHGMYYLACGMCVYGITHPEET